MSAKTTKKFSKKTSPMAQELNPIYSLLYNMNAALQNYPHTSNTYGSRRPNLFSRKPFYQPYPGKSWRCIAVSMEPVNGINNMCGA